MKKIICIFAILFFMFMGIGFSSSVDMSGGSDFMIAKDTKKPPKPKPLGGGGGNRIAPQRSIPIA